MLCSCLQSSVGFDLYLGFVLFDVDEESGTSDQNDIDHPHVIYKHDFFSLSNLVPTILTMHNKCVNNNLHSNEQVDGIKNTFWMTIMEATEDPQNQGEWMWSHSIQHISKSEVELLK